MNKWDRAIHTVLTAVSLIILALFAVWWFNFEHIPNNFSGWFNFLDYALFVMVSYVIWHPILMAVFTWSVLSNIKPHKKVKPALGKKVAFITTYVPASEPPELLHQILPAMVAANYEHDTWLLDEGNDPAAKSICKQYGVKHFSRANESRYNTDGGKYARKTKGGNHNSWYDAYGHRYDFVAQMDTDFIPNNDFLTKTLGYFKDSKVAFVGTPQIYGNTEQSLIARGAAEQTYSFYGALLRGFHGMGMNMLIGANHVVRVKALEEVDHYSAHITEDLLTGMKLHANGWKSVYVSEALAIGEGPTTWQSYFAQQMRWAYGCMHILRHFSLNLFKSMTLRQKAYYFLLQQHYFSGLVMVLGTIGLILYFGFGINTANMKLEAFLIGYIPMIVVLFLMSLWLQRFAIRPKVERGLLWAGAIISAASWPIFFLAFIGVLRGKKLTYKVTPKGDKVINEDSIRLFLPHIVIGLTAVLGLASAHLTGRTSVVMIFWAIIIAASMLFVPFSQQILNSVFRIYDFTAAKVHAINNYYRIFELVAPRKALLPDAPSDTEKWLYSDRRLKTIIIFSLISFSFVTFSMTRFLAHNPALWTLFAFLALTVLYYIISLFVNIGTKDFDIAKHEKLISKWRPKTYPTVDIFLPTAGEETRVLANTWDGVKTVIDYYKGKIIVSVLDDSARKEVKRLAKSYGFNYEVRTNRGQYKKAGNLRHGFNVTNEEFIVIFDADFKPRFDFLNELLPYMSADPKLGIVQSPQYFDVNNRQNWLERGAGAVQELFYRFSQVSRQNHDAAICVGSNAIYRRKALNDTGGTALIEHSEDVHTGFNLRMHGWGLRYVPIVLAKGLCPDSMTAFFKQQYRWCMGSMSLLTSDKFWSTKLKLRARLSYFSGFMYYIHTALSSFIAPIIPLTLLILYPEAVKFEYTIYVLPAFLFSWIIYPLWHNSTYGLEAWAVRSVYGWSHLFAIYDATTRQAMSWTPTGAVKGRDYRYTMFRIMQIIFNFIPGIAWVGLSAWHILNGGNLAFIFMLLSGVLYLAVAAKVTFYFARPLQLAERADDNFVAESSVA